MRRELGIELNRDRDYPLFSKEYFRRRWIWRTILTNEGSNKPFRVYEGNSAFAIIGLIKAHFPRLFGTRVRSQSS